MFERSRGTVGTWILCLALSFFFAVNTTACAWCADSVPLVETKDFGGLTQELVSESMQGYQAALVVYDVKTQHYFRYRPQACATQVSPCSTFKIFNALVGLETGILQNENHTFNWDGTKYSISEWMRDQTLQSAITNSVVWYFQRLATAVGEKQMKEYVHDAHYGNEDISGGITKFWLGSTLKISPDEQVVFLKRLVYDELPFSKRSMAIVRGLIRLDQTDKGTLYGKTGSQMDNGKETSGWFVGYVAQPGRVYVFATNIQATDGAWGKKARQLTEKVLSKAGLL